LYVPKISLAATVFFGVTNLLPTAVKAQSGEDDLLQGAGLFNVPEIDPRWIAVEPDEFGFPSAYNTKVVIPSQEEGELTLSE